MPDQYSGSKGLNRNFSALDREYEDLLEDHCHNLVQYKLIRRVVSEWLSRQDQVNKPEWAPFDTLKFATKIQFSKRYVEINLRKLETAGIIERQFPDNRYNRGGLRIRPDLISRLPRRQQPTCRPRQVGLPAPTPIAALRLSRANNSSLDVVDSQAQFSVPEAGAKLTSPPVCPLGHDCPLIARMEVSMDHKEEPSPPEAPAAAPKEPGAQLAALDSQVPKLAYPPSPSADPARPPGMIPKHVLSRLPSVIALMDKLKEPITNDLASKVIAALGHAPLMDLDKRIWERFGSITSLGILPRLAGDVYSAYRQIATSPPATPSPKKYSEEERRDAQAILDSDDKGLKPLQRQWARQVLGMEGNDDD